jgi:hypothetical protein
MPRGPFHCCFSSAPPKSSAAPKNSRLRRVLRRQTGRNLPKRRCRRLWSAAMVVSSFLARLSKTALVQDPQAGRPQLLARTDFEARWSGRLILIAQRASLGNLAREFNITWFVHAIHKYRWQRLRGAYWLGRVTERAMLRLKSTLNRSCRRSICRRRLQCVGNYMPRLFNGTPRGPTMPMKML